jgi:hypothetical protein
MLRGRHRGLPVAIDRAVMLPAEFKQDRNDTQEETSQHIPDGPPFAHSETINSRNSRYTADIRQRPRRHSKRVNEDDAYREENGDGAKQGNTAVDEHFGRMKGP